MKSAPLAQYLDQLRRAGEDRAPVRREISPFRPRSLHSGANGEPRAPTPFERALKDVAIGARRPDPGLDRPPWDGRPPRRDDPAGEARPAPPTADFETRLIDARAEARRDGYAAGRADALEERARETAEAQERAVAERREFLCNEYARLEEAIAKGLEEVERRIADAASRLLAPFLMSEVVKQVADELAAAIARLAGAGGPGLIRIRGPQGVLALLRERVAALPVEIEYVEDAGVDVVVEAQSTRIATALSPWAEMLQTLAD